MRTGVLAAAVRARWLVLLSVTVVVAGAAITVAVQIRPGHLAEARVQVDPVRSDVNMRHAYYQGGLVRNQVSPYTTAFVGPAIREDVARRLRLPPTAVPTRDELSSTVVVEGERVTLVVAARAPEPGRAVALADAGAGAFVDAVRAQRPDPDDENHVDVTAEVVDRAPPPSEPASSSLGVGLAIGVVAGLSLGLASALVAHGRAQRGAGGRR